MTGPQHVPGVPFDLHASPGPVWSVDPASGAVRVTARPRTDIFVDPGGAVPSLDAATLLGTPPPGDFQLTARLDVDFAAAFDAGVLLLWVDERHWGKLCFERSPDGDPMVVSVVCRGVADDANAFVVDGTSVWLRVSRIDRTYAYHASLDGTRWRMVRYFTLDDPRSSATVGLEAQSPTGEGCAVTFDQIRFAGTRLSDVRDGT